MRVVITGATGFVGTYLTAHLAAHGHEVIALGRSTVSAPSGPGVVFRRLTLPDDDGARALFAELQPDAVLHLAAMSSVPDAERSPELAHRINVDGTRSVTRALAALDHPCDFHFVSSCVVYGHTPIAEQPVVEDSALRPINVYGESKVAAERVVDAFIPDIPGRTTILRPFNHFGAGQSPQFVLPSFARQIAQIASRAEEPRLTVGNLDVERDFLDVRDVVTAYRLVLEGADVVGTFNVSAGRTFKLRDLVNEMRRIVAVDFEIVQDPSRLRVNDLAVLGGSSDKLERATGWTPRIPMTTSLTDLLAYWHDALAGAG